MLGAGAQSDDEGGVRFIKGIIMLPPFVDSVEKPSRRGGIVLGVPHGRKEGCLLVGLEKPLSQGKEAIRAAMPFRQAV